MISIVGGLEFSRSFFNITFYCLSSNHGLMFLKTLVGSPFLKWQAMRLRVWTMGVCFAYPVVAPLSRVAMADMQHLPTTYWICFFHGCYILRPRFGAKMMILYSSCAIELEDKQVPVCVYEWMRVSVVRSLHTYFFEFWDVFIMELPVY